MGRTKSLKWQLLIGNTLIFNVLLLFFGLYIYWFSYQSLQLQMEKDLVHITDTMREKFDNALDMPVLMLKELRGYYKDLPKQESSLRTSATEAVLDSSLNTMITLFPLIDDIKVINQKAEIEGVYPEQKSIIGQSVIYEDYYINRPVNDEIQWSGVYKDAKTGMPTMTFSALCGETWIVVDLNISAFNLLFEKDKFDAVLSLALLDQYGNYLYDDDGSKTSQNQRYDDFDMVKKYDQSSPKMYLSPSDPKMLVAMIPIGKPNEWHLVISQNKQLLYAPLTGLTRVLIVAMVLISIVSILFLYLNLKSAVVDIDGLIQSTLELAQGNYYLVLPESRFTELRELTDHFAMMANQVEAREEEIHALNEELEAMVEELELNNQALEEGARIAQDATLSKTQFLANMSHEIRTPMNGMMGMMTLLEMTMLDHSQKTYLKTMHGSAESLLVILNDILDFSKIEAGKVAISSVSFNLKRLIEDLEVLFKASAQHKNLALTVKWAPDLPTYYVGDSNRLRQVLANIIGNAIKFTSQGTVNISVDGDPRITPLGETQVTLSFVVSDTGIGISEADQLNLFERFTQGNQKVSSSTAIQSANKGTGLGLAISQMLLDLMGGHIRLESTVGKGSVFTAVITLPVAQLSAEAIEADLNPIQLTATSTKLAEALKGMEILVVEDDATSAFLLNKYLGKFGATLNMVGDGQQAIDAIHQHQYDAVLMDVNMPVMDGLTAVKLIRGHNFKDRRGSRLPVVAMTAYAMDSDVERCMAAGMSDYLSKPINLEALFEKMKSIADALQKSTLISLKTEKQVTTEIQEVSSNGSATYLEIFNDFRKASDLDDEVCHFLLKTYIEQVQLLLIDLRRAMDTNSYDEISNLLHRLKGTSGNVRANRIMTMALVAENANRANEKEVLVSQIEQVEALISSLQDAIEPSVSG